MFSAIFFVSSANGGRAGSFTSTITARNLADFTVEVIGELIPIVMYLDVRKTSIRSVFRMMVRAHIFISGRVQGVFFRAETENKANRHNLMGWVRNLPDGRVEAVFEGEKAKVDAVIEFCRRGPPGAYVSRLDITWEDWTGEFKEFRISHGT
jgi:acylphosphatase